MPGKNIEGLYLSLGLDFTQLDADFAATDKEVRSKMAELSRQTKALKLETSVKLNGITGAGAESKRLEVTVQSLNEQLKIQEQRVMLVTQAYQQTVKATGEASVASQNMYNRVLQESKAYSDLSVSIQKSQSQLSTVAKEVNNLKSSGGLTKETGTPGAGILALGTKVAAITVALSALKSAMNTVNDAAKAGDNIYKLSTRMNMATEDASKMNQVLQLGGMSIQDYTSTMIKLERSVLNAGENGNEVTKAMEKFGLTITDNSGKLLPMNEQLTNLAEAYQKASAAGEGEAFVAQVLGARGSALVPVLQDWNDIQEALAKSGEGVRMSTEQAHQLVIESKVLDIQWAQLKTSFGAAMLPLARELIPLAISGMNKLKTAINAVNDILDVARKKRENHGLMAALPIQAFTDEAEAQIQAEKMAEKAKLATRDAALKANAEQAKSEQALAAQKEKAAKEAERLAKEEAQKKAEAEREKQQAVTEFNNKVLELYQTSLDKRLMDIEREKQAFIKKGVDEVESTKWAEQAKLDAVRSAAQNALKSDKKRFDEVRALYNQSKSGGTATYKDANGNTKTYTIASKDINARAQEMAQRWGQEDAATKYGLQPGETITPEMVQMYEAIRKTSDSLSINGLQGNSSVANALNAGKLGIQSAASPTFNISVSVDGSIVQDDGTVNKLADRVADRFEVVIKNLLGGGGNGY